MLTIIVALYNKSSILLLMTYTIDMVYENYGQKDSVVVVFTGEGKGKTSAALGMITRALGSGFKVAFVQFIKYWDVGEHKFIEDVAPIYKDKLLFKKGGLGFYNAGELSADISEDDHKNEARLTYNFALSLIKSGEYQLVVCDEINNAVHDGLLNVTDLENLIKFKHQKTSLCLTGRNFPNSLIDKVDIVTDMTKVKHHYDDKLLANKGIDY